MYDNIFNFINIVGKNLEEYHYFTRIPSLSNPSISILNATMCVEE